MHATYEKSDFQAYLEELLAIPSTDILVHCSSENKQLIYCDKPTLSPISFALTSEWKRLLAFASSVHKSADTHTLCLAIDTVQLNEQHQTPIWLLPLRYRILKNTQRLEISFDWEDAFLNPYLTLELKKIHIEIGELDSLDTFEEKQASLSEKLTASHYTISETAIIGNFHHHRFLLVKELEELQTQIPSPLVQSILGNETETTEVRLAMDEGNLTSLDRDQQNVIRQLENHSLVVEGPPGTGKSELITNCLAKRLTSPVSQLVVSEKKTALEVIAKKLAQHNLHPYCFSVTSETRSKDLIDKLIETWKFVENAAQNVRPPSSIGKQKRANLQLLLDKLTAKELFGGISYSEFLVLLAGKKIDDVPFVSQAPSLKDWLQARDKIQELYTQHPSISNLKLFQKVCFEPAVRLDEVVAAVNTEIRFVVETFGVTCISDVEALLSEVVYAQLIENEVVKKQFTLFEKESARKKFKKLYIELQKKQKEVALAAVEMTVWNVLPTALQLVTWEQAMTTGSWWTRRKINKQLNHQLKDTNLPLNVVLENARKYVNATAELVKLEIDCLQVGVQPITAELESTYQWMIQWESSEGSKLKEVAKKNSEHRLLLIENNQRIKQLLQKVRTYFSISASESLLTVGEQLQHMYSHSLPFAGYLNQLPLSFYTVIQRATSFEELEALVLKSQLVQLENLFPQLRTFSGEELGRKLEDIIQVEKGEQAEFVQFIHAKRAEQFHNYHRLIQTSTLKISPEEKALRTRLKKGKSLLVKEFAKTRHTKSIRELLASDAKEWIELLLPVWLCTPGQVATSFPMETSFFDLVIFDEASQLPLTHALGALQRSARALVCGDSKQMAPGSYFSKKSEQVDLLHHASYYWKTANLTHHYRSQHPALITFSNKHFYNNQLLAYPSRDQQAYPIHRHVCTEGVFTDRKNIPEAREIALAIEKQLEQSTDTVGVVAFSNEQLMCIWEQLSPKAQEQLTENSEQGKGFFKTLEQVQGEECERLFISIGYAKNEAGKFQLRMGPLNRRNGHRRLNVLFTRAQKSIHLFTSVTSKDFPLTDNESIQLLRLYLQDLEQAQDTNSMHFPYGLSPKRMNESTLKFDGIYDVITEADELLNFHQVLRSRGWLIHY